MQFEQAFQPAILIQRYKRFLADVELSSGRVITLHCPNTGSMKNCQTPGSRVWFTDSGNDKRKYPCTWQVVEVNGLHLVGINTGIANKLVHEAIAANRIAELAGFPNVRTEVPYGSQKSRVDLLLENDITGTSCYVEVKNVSMGIGKGRALFPDAVTLRGQKHLQELIQVRAEGDRAVLFFCVQHDGVDTVAPADEIDPEYGNLLRQAVAAGVEVVAYGAEFNVAGSRINLTKRLRVEL